MVPESYYLSQDDKGRSRGPYQIADIQKIAREVAQPVKFFTVLGFLAGTVYPNGEVQR